MDEQKMQAEIDRHGTVLADLNEALDAMNGGALPRILERAKGGAAVTADEWREATDAFEAALERASQLYAELDPGVRAVLPREVVTTLDQAPRLVAQVRAVLAQSNGITHGVQTNARRGRGRN